MNANQSLPDTPRDDDALGDLDDWDDFDDSNRDDDPDDPNDSIWDDNYEGESSRLGCCMPDRCLMPGEHHGQ